MFARVREILASVLIVGFLIASAISGLALLHYRSGRPSEHLRLIGVAEAVGFAVILAAGLATMIGAAPDLRPGKQVSASDRMWASAALIAGASLVAAAVLGFVSPESLRAAAGRS
jgi:hypothetical protein